MRAGLVWSVCTLVLVLVPPAGAEEPLVFPGLPDQPSVGLSQSGLLDHSRFDVRHSMSFGMSSTSLGTSSGGLWITELGYRISDPLRVSVDIGAALDTGGGPVNHSPVFVHGFNLDYRPSRNFQVSVSYRNAPGGVSPALGMRPGRLGWTATGPRLGDDR